MTIKYLSTDLTDDITVNWYEIYGERFGITSDGRILDREGAQLTDGIAQVLSLIGTFEGEAK